MTIALMQQEDFLQEEERALVMDVWKVFDKKGENQINVIDLPTVFQVYTNFSLAAKT